MSSRRRPGSTTKKKFGKNLNKLTEKPAPPITAPARGASRNGLLLLSTKRASSTATTSAGLLASKPAVSPSKETAMPLGVTTESYTSAHDALLGAVIGASRTADPQQPPDAWGVAASDKPEGDVSSDGITAPETANLPMSEKETTVGGPDQGIIMSKLAHERAEQRRLEEEARTKEQQARAEQRLRELEEKMAVDKQRAAPTSLLTRPSGMNENETQQVEPLLRAEDGASAMEYNRSRARPRALYDPSRPFSALVGANSTERDAPPSQDGPIGAASVVNIAPEPMGMSERQEPHFHMVNLSSYEDRDRGVRSDAAGPRMLFDPKSGSMVAVKNRDKADTSTKTNKPKGRTGRALMQERAGETSETVQVHVSEIKSKKGKGRKEDTRRRPENSAKDETKVRSRGRGDKQGMSSESRLPRTCGVLYTRDKKGNYACADACDGDLGYGCHSMPGGRVQNPSAYRQYMDDQQIYESGAANEHGIGGYDHAGASMSPHEKDSRSPKALAPAVDWVKPNEKIELVTGAMESPTLRATAGEWAPSRSALDAATAAKRHQASMNGTPTVLGRDPDVNDGEDVDLFDEDELPSFIGLGFDPAENMDSVMRSPSSERKTKDSEGLSALALDAPRSNDPTARNIFAFGGSPTWGEPGAHGTQDLNGWSMLGGDAASGNPEAKAASFLSLATGNPWGTGDLSGLSGRTVPQAHSSERGAGD